MLTVLYIQNLRNRCQLSYISNAQNLTTASSPTLEQLTICLSCLRKSFRADYCAATIVASPPPPGRRPLLSDGTLAKCPGHIDGLSQKLLPIQGIYCRLSLLLQRVLYQRVAFHVACKGKHVLLQQGFAAPLAQAMDLLVQHYCQHNEC